VPLGLRQPLAVRLPTWGQPSAGSAADRLAQLLDEEIVFESSPAH